MLFIINMTTFIFIQKNKNETIYQTLFSNDAYFTEDEIKGIQDNKNNKNIYYIILEGAVSLKLYNDNFTKIDDKKIISDFKKLNFNYIEDVRPSYTNTQLALSQVFNLDYLLNEKSAAYTHYSKLYPWIMSNFEKTPLGKILEKIDYDFFWVGHSISHCSYYNISLCMHHEKKEKSLFKNIIPNILLIPSLSKS